jgi:hypothetical protein
VRFSGAQCCPFVLFACRDRGFCACSHGLLDLKSAGRRATVYLLYFFRISSGRGGESSWRLGWPTSSLPLTGRSGSSHRKIW